MAFNIVDENTIIKNTTANKKYAELYSSMTVPSSIHAYSIGIQYIQNWFLSKFAKTYFKTVHLDGKHVFDDFRNFDKIKTLKTLKPSVAIVPEIQWDWDREKVDSYPFGLDQYLRRSSLQNSFFKDTDKNMYLGIAMDQMQINTTFRVRVATKAQQVDLARFMKNAFRVGYTQGEYVDMDIHIPYGTMLQVAQDAGFKIENNMIKNNIDFISYLNSHSQIPVLFKYREINGKNEYFLRFKDIYMHIRCPDDLNVDNGERVEMIYDNFMIEMVTELQIPAPKMYMYYSRFEHDMIEDLETDTTGLGMTSVKLPNVPEKNSKGWNLFLTTEYYNQNIGTQLVIDFKDLFNEDNEIGKVIDYNKDIQVSSSIFLEFKLFKDGDPVDYIMDWSSLVLTSKDNMINTGIVQIFVYTNLLYMNDQIKIMEEMNKDRLRE